MLSIIWKRDATDNSLNCSHNSRCGEIKTNMKMSILSNVAASLVSNILHLTTMFFYRKPPAAWIFHLPKIGKLKFIIRSIVSLFCTMFAIQNRNWIDTIFHHRKYEQRFIVDVVSNVFDTNRNTLQLEMFTKRGFNEITQLSKRKSKNYITMFQQINSKEFGRRIFGSGSNITNKSHRFRYFYN